MSFNFGSNPNTTGGFTLGGNPSTTSASLAFGSGSGDSKSVSKPASTFFGAPTASSASLTFGTATSASGLSFGTSSSQSGLSFGTMSSTAAVSNFGAKSASTGLNLSTTTSISAPLSFGASTRPAGLVAGAATSTPGLNFGATSTAATPLNFVTPGSTNVSSFPLPNTTSVSLSASTPQFGFGSKAGTTAASTTSFTPIIGSTTPSSGISLSTSLATSSAAPVSLSFRVASAAPATTTAATTATGILPTSIAALTSTATTSIPSAGGMAFAQLEDSINKWTIDLEEQGKFFINQAKQLNAWDSLLISNGEKILNLNGSIERVKQQQQQLDQELDFVLAQQKELEELIRPLEKELVDIPVTDIDRNQMYQFAEIIDSQLKQMSDDLKEIIEHINDSNKDEEITNPVSQISRILNAHMNSLQWIDRNTAQINAHLEQITKIQDSNRRNFALNQSFNHSYNM